MRVLAADDEDLLMRSLSRWLKSWGYEPVIAKDGLEAWKALKQTDAPRLAILDWDMPGLSGLEVCRLLRSTPHGDKVYVLMLTGRQEKADVIAALESGADDFLSKPFHARELQLRLAKAVRDTARATVPPAPASDASDAPRSSAAPPTGTVLGGKFRLEHEIGRGGMGSVWLGVHLSLGINVAIKFMDPGLTETPDYASFEREARAAAQLRSEHIVRVYDHGLTRDGQPYLVLEYLDGEPLWARVTRDGALDLDLVVSIIEQAARALTEAHAHGVVHRDVKPENILLVEDPERPHGVLAKLIDFGLAKQARVGAGEGPEVGSSAGTPSYMSPECLGGRAPAGPALDTWGLAATAFFAATGVVPFNGIALTDLFKQICVDPLPVPSRVNARVPPELDAWFARACAREPSVRYQGAAELASELRAAYERSRERQTSPTGSTSQITVKQPDVAGPSETVPFGLPRR